VRPTGSGGEIIAMSDYVEARGAGSSSEAGGHIELAALLGYGRDQIGGAAGDAIREHCLACPSCGKQLALILLLLEVKANRAARRRRVIVAVAATVVVSMALVAAVIAGAARLPASASAVVDARQLATAEGPERVDLDFIYPNLMPVGGGELPDKRASLALIVDGRYADAAERLTVVYSQRPADAEVATLLGVALYLDGDDAGRVEDLLLRGTELRRQDLQHTAQWFLANHYLRRGDVVKARNVLIELSQWPDSPGGKASVLLERLGAETP